MKETARRKSGNAFPRVWRATTFCVGLVAALTVMLAVVLVGFSVMLAVVFGMFAQGSVDAEGAGAGVG